MNSDSSQGRWEPERQQTDESLRKERQKTDQALADRQTTVEEDADMVVLLHREDAYEKESPRAGEADFIVAKHRNGPTDTITVAFQGHYSRFVDMAQS